MFGSILKNITCCILLFCLLQWKISFLWPHIVVFIVNLDCICWYFLLFPILNPLQSWREIKNLCKKNTSHTVVPKLCHESTKEKILVAQSSPTFCGPRGCGPPGCSVHGILQAGLLEWVSHSLLQGIIPTQGISLPQIRVLPYIMHLLMKQFRMLGFQLFQFIYSDVRTFYSLHLKEEEQSYKATTKMPRLSQWF